MSEYQYYEFRAIDRPLTREEMGELRALSTRAEITPTSFTNTYHWGDFKGNPDVLMTRYFDAFVYVANWGTHRLMFRIPGGVLNPKTVEAYCDGEVLALKAGKDHVVLEFASREEENDEDFIEGEHWMPSLISLRAELIRGDARALYLGWLASLPRAPWGGEGGDWRDGDEGAEGDVDGEQQVEPPVPPGLSTLSAPLRSLAEFLRVEDELIEVAAAASVGQPPAPPSRADMLRWVRGLPTEEKDAYLVRILADESDLALRAELARRFREATAPGSARSTPGGGRRTVAELLAARDALVEAKRRKAAERAAAERARQERERAAARQKHLDALARREPAAWAEVDALIATKRPKEYDRAVELLVDLRELAAQSGRTAEAVARFRVLRERHVSKPALIRRLDEADLGNS